jgi:hypothetical protein
MAGASNLDHALSALVLIRDAQRALDSALRLPSEDRAALAGQIQAVRRGMRDVASSLAGAVPGGPSLVSAGQALGEGLANRPELRALGGVVSFLASQSSHALDAVAGAAESFGGERDRSLALSDRITHRLTEVGIATRSDLARELEVDPRSTEFRDALERTLGTGHAEWYGSVTYGLPRDELEAMLAKAREVADEEAPAPAPEAPVPSGAMAELRAAVDGLQSAIERQVGRASP